jgi:hypothetical protein
MTFVSSTIFQPSYTRARRSPTLDQVRPAVCGRVDESPLVGRLRDVPDEVRDELAARAAIALYADPLRLSNAAERLRTAKQPRTRTRATMTGKSWSVPFESLREPRLHGVPASVERRPRAISGGPSPFRLPFESDSARRSQLPEKGKSRWNAGFRMARPGLEPGTPRFSVVGENLSNRAESLQIPTFSSYLDLGPVVAICVLSLSIWVLDVASVPNQIAPSRYEPWRGRAENDTERMMGRASGRAALEPAALRASTMPQKDRLAGLWSRRSPGSNPVAHPFSATRPSAGPG